MMAGKFTHHELEKEIDVLARELLDCKSINDNLRKSESQKNAFLDSITTSLVYINDQLEIQWLNAAAADSICVDLNEIKGKTCHKLRAGSEIPCSRCPALKSFKTGKTEQNIIHTPDGRIWDAKCEPVFDDQGKMTGVLTIAHNVTENMRIEKQLRQIQKMNAVAGLAGGIAHQFNNALVGIIGNIELIQMTLNSEANPKKYLESMKESVNRITSLTSQLLAYARGGKYQTRRTSLNEFVKLLLVPIQETKRPGVEIVAELSDSKYFVKIDPTQMQMAINAVISNAMEAIEDIGRIKIEIKLESISNELKAFNPLIKTGDFVRLSVEDNGKGMAPEVLKRIFEPFFTTNFQGRGLSMAAVYGIVENHDGWIAVGSEPGKGTVVNIYLPVTEALPLREGRTDAGPGRGFRTVLLVEDDEIMMDIVRTMLENMGYHVLSSGTGTDAAMIAYTRKNDIDLILLDTELPDKEGKDLFMMLKKVRPDVEIVIMDYSPIAGTRKEWAGTGAHYFLTKPFTKNQLKEILISILERGTS